MNTVVSKDMRVQPEVWLIVWSETSIIGKAAESAIAKTFKTINTSKNAESQDRMYLDICNIPSIKWFVKEFSERYPGLTLKVLFLNSGNMMSGDTLDRGNMIRRINSWEKDLNTNIHNLMLVEHLQRAWIINQDTKIIYNASVQILVPKPGTEDYAKVKSMVANILLSDENLDVTVLALSLVEWSNMTDTFQKRLEKNWGNLQEYIAKNMPEWQPTLDQVSYITEKIIENREQTRGKIVCLDWWITKSLPKQEKIWCIYFDQQTNSFKTLE